MAINRRRKIRTFSTRRTPLEGEYRRTWDRFAKRSFSDQGRTAIHRLLHLAKITAFPAHEIAKMLDKEWREVWRRQKPSGREYTKTLTRIREQIINKRPDEKTDDLPF